MLAVIALLGDLAPQENGALPVAIGAWTQQVAHAELRHHGSRHARGLLQVVAGAGGELVEDDLFRGPAAHGGHDIVLEFLARDQHIVAGGQRHHIAAGAPARHNRDLVHRAGIFQEVEEQGVPRFVIGDLLFLFRRDDAAAAFRSHDHALH